MPTATADKAPPTIGQVGFAQKLWNGEKWVSRAEFQAGTDAPVLQRAGGRSTATKPQRSDLMAMGMNDKLPPGQEQRIAAADLGDSRLRNTTTNNDGVTITSNEPAKYIQYDDWGIARRVNRSCYLEIKRAVDKEGHRLHDSCPLCGGDHPETEWDPNACTARKPLSGWICPHPECGKEIWPDLNMGAEMARANNANPALKTVALNDGQMERMALANLHTHIGTYHPTLARAMNIPLNALTHGGSGLAAPIAVGAR